MLALVTIVMIVDSQRNPQVYVHVYGSLRLRVTLVQKEKRL